MSHAKSALPLLFLAAATVSAQVSGRLTGTIVDTSGASVPNAKVGLYLPTGKTPLLSTTTNAEGIFDFVAVRPGLYNLQIESPGFTTHTQADVKIDPVRQLLLPPIALAVASASQAVEISANVTTVDTATSEISTTVSQAQIFNLPVLNRQVSNLFNTQAGVTQNNRTATVINGMRPSFSNVTLDGILVQDSVRTNAGGRVYSVHHQLQSDSGRRIEHHRPHHAVRDQSVARIRLRVQPQQLLFVE